MYCLNREEYLCVCYKLDNKREKTTDNTLNSMTTTTKKKKIKKMLLAESNEQIISHTLMVIWGKLQFLFYSYFHTRNVIPTFFLIIKVTNNMLTMAKIE